MIYIQDLFYEINFLNYLKKNKKKKKKRYNIDEHYEEYYNREFKFQTF